MPLIAQHLPACTPESDFEERGDGNARHEVRVHGNGIVTVFDREKDQPRGKLVIRERTTPSGKVIPGRVVKDPPRKGMTVATYCDARTRDALTRYPDADVVDARGMFYTCPTDYGPDPGQPEVVGPVRAKIAETARIVRWNGLIAAVKKLAKRVEAGEPVDMEREPVPVGQRSCAFMTKRPALVGGPESHEETAEELCSWLNQRFAKWRIDNTEDDDE